MKQLITLIIATIMVLSLPVNAIAAEPDKNRSTEINTVTEDETIATPASAIEILATYFDYDFYMGSQAKKITLPKYCTQITYRCICADGSYDAMYIIITDLNGGGYNKYIAMAADGQSHTISLYLPAGSYEVTLSGSIKLHSHAAINFKGYA